MRRKTCRAAVAVLGILVVGALISDSGQRAPAQEPKKSTTKPVPFKLAKPDKPLILLETMVHDRGPYRFVLDTGAGLTIISPDLANKLDVKRAEAQKAVGAGGSVAVNFGVVKSLAVGETRLEGLKVGIMDLRGISSAIETDIDGIIGYNFLKQFRVSIDYPKQTVTFE
jgi:predicted aspartyl protease